MPDELLAAISTAVRSRGHDDPYEWIRETTEEHRRSHRCGAYSFADGTVLGAIASVVRPAEVLELGTALGYTACWWASVADHVDTVEGEPRHVPPARRTIERTELADRVTVHEGDFAEVVPGLGRSYDVAFFDGFVPTSDVLALLAEALAPSGVLVSANLHLDGGVRRALRDRPGWRTTFLDPDLAVSTRLGVRREAIREEQR